MTLKISILAQCLIFLSVFLRQFKFISPYILAATFKAHKLTSKLLNNSVTTSKTLVQLNSDFRSKDLTICLFYLQTLLYFQIIKLAIYLFYFIVKMLRIILFYL